jgi:hypothetical protein
MNYVEWLRIRNLLKIVGIVLTILVLLAIVLRISVARYMSPEAWVSHFTLDRGTKVSHTVLPDGTKRMILDDTAKQTHVVIDDHGYAGKHIVVTEPSKRAHEEHNNVSVGSIHVFETHQGSMTTTVVDTNGSVPMLYYMLLADIVAILVATILAAPLAREIDGHLEIALTRPCTRARYAIGAIAVNAAGIVAASVMTVVAFYLCQLLFESARLDFSGVNTRAIVMGIAFPLAWYAMLCAATTWLHRSYVAVLASALPVAIVVGLLTLVQPSNVITLFVHDVAWVISRLDPLSYVTLATPSSNGSVDYGGSNFPLRLSIEVLFFVVYGAIAIWQWQRVEA